jgi:hypothetical protein
MMPALFTSTSHASEGGFRGVEQAGHGSRVRDVGLGGDGAAAGRFDLGDQGLGRFSLAGVVDDDDEAVLRQALRDGGADAARCAGDDGDFVGGVDHGVSPCWWPPRVRRPMRRRCLYPSTR